jgi:hypothetical protein
MRRLNPTDGEEGGGRLAEFTHIIMDEIRESASVFDLHMLCSFRVKVYNN